MMLKSKIICTLVTFTTLGTSNIFAQNYRSNNDQVNTGIPTPGSSARYSTNPSDQSVNTQQGSSSVMGSTNNRRGPSDSMNQNTSPNSSTNNTRSNESYATTPPGNAASGANSSTTRNRNNMRRGASQPQSSIKAMNSEQVSNEMAPGMTSTNDQITFADNNRNISSDNTSRTTGNYTLRT